MKIGLYFGSFNPIHIGHLIIANHVSQNYDIEQVWFIVSPQNPLKKTSGLLNEYDRLFLVQTAIEDNTKLRCSDIEFKLPRPSYTVDTLIYLAEKYQQHEFTVIMGSDSFSNISKWKNSYVILNNYSLYVYERPGFKLPISRENITVSKPPLLDISSTYIRTAIQNGKSIQYLVPEKVLEEIERNGYYKK